MSIDRKTVEKLAQLARISFNEADLQSYQSSLSHIVELIDQINSANTENVEPMAHPLVGMVQRMREDKVSEIDHHLEYQESCQATEAGLYLVPTVIEGA